MIHHEKFVIRFNTTLDNGICEISETGDDEDFLPTDLCLDDFDTYFKPKIVRGEDWESLSEGLDDYEYWFFDMSHKEGIELVKQLTTT